MPWLDRGPATALQDRMHLDCVFSIISDDCCIMMDEMMGKDSPTRRLVDEWVRDAESGAYGRAREGVEFAEYVRGEGWHIIPIKASHQLVRPVYRTETCVQVRCCQVMHHRFCFICVVRLHTYPDSSRETASQAYVLRRSTGVMF